MQTHKRLSPWIQGWPCSRLREPKISPSMDELRQNMWRTPFPDLFPGFRRKEVRQKCKLMNCHINEKNLRITSFQHFFKKIMPPFTFLTLPLNPVSYTFCFFYRISLCFLSTPSPPTARKRILLIICLHLKEPHPHPPPRAELQGGTQQAWPSASAQGDPEPRTHLPLAWAPDVVLINWEPAFRK